MGYILYLFGDGVFDCGDGVGKFVFIVQGFRCFEFRSLGKMKG